MLSAWRDRNAWSTSVFLRVVLPETPWRDMEVINVEGSQLDRENCVDMIVRYGSFLVTVGVRVQTMPPGRLAYDTFTARYTAENGSATTEYQKIINGQSLATHHVQAYVDQEERLLSAACIKRPDLVGPLFEAHAAGQIRPNHQEAGRPVDFVWVSWEQCRRLYWSV